MKEDILNIPGRQPGDAAMPAQSDAAPKTAAASMPAQPGQMSDAAAKAPVAVKVAAGPSVPKDASAAKKGDAPSDPASADESRGGVMDASGFSVPEGFDPDAYGERFAEVAGELGLSIEGAEKLSAFWSEVAADVSAAREDAWKEARRDWAYRTLRDRELGGANLERTIQLASRVVNAYGNEELKEVFRATGLGNHPEVVRFMSRLGRALGEDDLHVGSMAAAGGPKSPAELIYGRK